jgi:hypothetical protein
MRVDPELLVEVVVATNASNDPNQWYLAKPSVAGFKSGFLFLDFLKGFYHFKIPSRFYA